MSASSGTLIAAGLESAGYKAQELVLAQLAPVLSALSVALFLFVAGRAMWIFVHNGQLRPALWLLLGPIILALIMNTRTDSGGVEWQFGSFKGDPKYVQKFVDGNIASNVSWPFDAYNRFVSGLSESLIGLALNNPVSSTILFTIRQQIYDLIMNVNVVSPGLRSLIHEGLQGKCGDWMAASRDVARGNRDPVFMGTPQYQNALADYDKYYMGAPVVLQAEGAAYKYVLDLLSSVSTGLGSVTSEADQLVLSMCEGESQDLLEGGKTPLQIVNAPATCEQVWCWSAVGLVLEAQAALNESLNQTVQKNPAYQAMSAADQAAILEDILKDIAVKVSPDPDPVSGVRFDNDPSVIPVVIAGRLLKLELERDPRGSIYDEFAEGSRVKIQSYQPAVQLTSNEMATLREQASDYSTTVMAETKALSLAFSLPYLQGSLLYALALLFPFFAVVALVPRRRSSILFWAAAWLWVKSWDVGWAIVMLIDQILWELMPHHAYYKPVALGVNSPITVLESAFDSDPTYSLATYYGLVAFLLMAIPTVTGQILLRGVATMSQFLFSGMSANVSDPYSQIQNNTAQGELSAQAERQGLTFNSNDPLNLLPPPSDSGDDSAALSNPASQPTANIDGGAPGA